ncbi:MAG TPA: hypothetical protein VNN80_12930 [Polyangiaceae bacterium]|nr:hypothetical protein [Polyangiaceae bacterium]
MKRLALLLALALGCGGDEYPPENCEPALPPSNDDGDPWPTYGEANATLATCADGALTRRRGTCSDGKTFIETAGAFAGDTYYFKGEVLVGVLRYSDVVLACDEYRFGDARCQAADVEELSCPEAG